MVDTRASKLRKNMYRNLHLRAIREQAAARTIQKRFRQTQANKFKRLTNMFNKRVGTFRGVFEFARRHAGRTVTPNMLKYSMMLQRHGLTFAATLLAKLMGVGPLLGTFFRNANVSQANRVKMFQKYIGLCHVDRSNKNFVGSLLSQYKIIADLYYKTATANKESGYIQLVKEKVGVHPCINNLLEQLTSTVVGETFRWTGTKNLIQTKNGYHKVMMNAVSSLINSNAKYSNTNKNFSKKTTNQRVNAFWSRFKNQQLYVNRGGQLVFIPVKNYNTNGRNFRNYYKMIMGNSDS